MELTTEEKRKACSIAALEVERRQAQFKPQEKSVIRDEKGWVSEQYFMGSVGDEMVCASTLQWNYSSSGAIGRITQVVHVRLLCSTKTSGRFLRVVDFHVPQWGKERGTSPTCLCCGDGFAQREVLVADTSLQEY